MRFLLALLVALMIVPTALGAPSAIFTAQTTGQRAFNDPIVSPGVRSAHEHCVYGNTINQTETEDTLNDASHVSTWAISSNRTSIWIPCIYEDGIPVQVYPGGQRRDILAYYQPVKGTECMPPLNMAGVTREVQWRGQLNSGTLTALPPTSSVDGSLVAVLTFRGTRDFGVSCFPNVKVYFRFNIGAGPIGNITIGGPVAEVDGAHGPETMHGDYFFAHNRDFFQRFLNQCVIPGIACGTNPPL